MTRPRKIFWSVGATFAGLVLLGAIVGPAPAPEPAAVAAPTASATPAPVPAPEVSRPTPPAPVAAPAPAAPRGPETVTVSNVIDGDTSATGDGRKIRVLGVDSCEANTYGGKEATSAAKSQLDNPRGPVTLTAEPGVDTDRYGRHLRYVQVGGEAMVGYDHTGVYQGKNDADADHIARLYAQDTRYAMNPPSGRSCEDPYPSAPAASEDNVDVDVDRGGHHNMPDGALTGGYCARKWWC